MYTDVRDVAIKWNSSSPSRKARNTWPKVSIGAGILTANTRKASASSALPHSFCLAEAGFRTDTVRAGAIGTYIYTDGATWEAGLV